MQRRPPGGFTESCEQPGSYLSSLVAFDLTTGAPVWSYRVCGPPLGAGVRLAAAHGHVVRGRIRQW